MATGKRNRQKRGSPTGNCARIKRCEHTHRGRKSCAKNKCSQFLDYKDPKAKKYI